MSDLQADTGGSNSRTLDHAGAETGFSDWEVLGNREGGILGIMNYCGKGVKGKK